MLTEVKLYLHLVASTGYPLPAQPVHYPTTSSYQVRGSDQAAGMPPQQMQYPPPNQPATSADGSVYKYSNGVRQPPPQVMDKQTTQGYG